MGGPELKVMKVSRCSEAPPSPVTSPTRKFPSRYQRLGATPAWRHGSGLRCHREEERNTAALLSFVSMASQICVHQRFSFCTSPYCLTLRVREFGGGDGLAIMGGQPLCFSVQQHVAAAILYKLRLCSRHDFEVQFQYWHHTFTWWLY